VPTFVKILTILLAAFAFLLSFAVPVLLLFGFLWTAGILFPNLADNTEVQDLMILAISSTIFLFFYEMIGEPVVKSVLQRFDFPVRLKLIPEILFGTMTIYSSARLWTPHLHFALSAALFVGTLDVTVGYFLENLYAKK
jgi:hypothetical protein